MRGKLMFNSVREGIFTFNVLLEVIMLGKKELLKSKIIH